MSSDVSTTNVKPRTLARVARIISLEPIAGADRIVQARVMGWDVVVQKDEFQPDDLCVFFSIDSVLDPDNPEFAAIKGRIRTCKIRGVVSQGLAKPLSILPYYGIDPATVREHDDLTRALKVTKYVFCEDVEANEQGSFGHGGKAALPPGMNVTGETRIQECGARIARFAAEAIPVVITRKEDGTSTSFYFRNKTDVRPELFAVCGHHTVRTAATKESLHYFRMEARYDIERKMRELGRDLIIQGEIVGPGIQCNRLALKELEFRCFYIWDIRAQRKLSWCETVALCGQLGIPTVPVIYQGPFERDWTPASLLAWAAKLDYVPGKPAEGFVVSTLNEPGEPQESFKVISNRFLLKNNL
jgi:RNA ligase (TIGR02306 family)